MFNLIIVILLISINITNGYPLTHTKLTNYCHTNSNRNSNRDRVIYNSVTSVDTTPDRLATTKNYLIAQELSNKFKKLANKNIKKKVLVIGGGLSGLACAKYLTDSGHEAIVHEARGVLGGKVSAWKDKDGDWIETGLHIFFGAYPNMMNLFAELQIKERLQWKKHQMTFAMQNLPGQYTSFQFLPGVPAPFNMALAILTNTEMLSWTEKILMVPALLPMLIQGQDFIDAQDELSVLEFMEKYGMPTRVNDEIFIAMSKALDFIDPQKLSMTVILTAMNRFINEADGSQTAFLDGNAPDRLCKPMAEYIEKHGGKVYTNSPILEILTDDIGKITGLKMEDGRVETADEYVSAMPVDVFKRLIPKPWSTMPYFAQISELEGIPVINIQIWFDKKLDTLDGLIFSRSPLLSVYADMSVSCKEYEDPNKSMLELVFAPCTPKACADDATNPVNWMGKSNEEIIDATMGELFRLFPNEIAYDSKWPSIEKASNQIVNSKDNNKGAKVIKYSVVKTPRSVYAAYPGRNKYRPSQRSPIPNFTLAGDWSSQKYLGSMEGAVFGGKLAAQVIAEKAAKENSYQVDLLEPKVMEIKAVRSDILEKLSKKVISARDPLGIIDGNNEAIIYGGGADLEANSLKVAS